MTRLFLITGAACAGASGAALHGGQPVAGLIAASLALACGVLALLARVDNWTWGK